MEQSRFADCVKKMQSGDREGLKIIYEEYVGYIYTVVYGILPSKEDAEDVTSEFFIHLWDIKDKIKTEDVHKAFLVTVARNMALDFYRKNRAKEYLDEEMAEEPSGENIENDVIADVSLKEALLSLKEEERQVVSMKILSEMTFEEISKTLNCPMGTVTWRYQNAIKKLRRYGYE